MTTLGLFGSLFLGIAIVLLPALVATFGPESISSWTGPYIAGCFGGLVLELVVGKGQLEMPGPPNPGEDPAEPDIRGSLGNLFDIGFLARVFLGGMAAVAFLLVFNSTVSKLSGDELQALTDDAETFGWAILLGLSSPAVWVAGQRVVEARLASFKLETAEEGAADAQEKVEEAKQHLKDADTSTTDVVVVDPSHLDAVLNEVGRSDPSLFDILDARTRVRSGPVPTVNPLIPDAISKLDEAIGALKTTRKGLRTRR